MRAAQSASCARRGKSVKADAAPATVTGDSSRSLASRCGSLLPAGRPERPGMIRKPGDLPKTRATQSVGATACESERLSGRVALPSAGSGETGAVMRAIQSVLISTLFLACDGTSMPADAGGDANLVADAQLPHDAGV